MILKIAASSAVLFFAHTVQAGDCSALALRGSYRACETVRVKGAVRAVVFREVRRGQIDLSVHAVSGRTASAKPVLQMKAIGQALVPVRAAGKNVVYRAQTMLFRDVTGDKSPELIFRVKNGRHADLYVLDLRRLDAYPELQFLEVSQLQNPDGGNARNFMIHDAAKDVIVLQDGSIGAAASDPFLGVDPRFMAFASYRNGRMGIEYIERRAFERRLKGATLTAGKAAKKKKTKRTAQHANKSNERI